MFCLFSVSVLILLPSVYHRQQQDRHPMLPIPSLNLYISPGDFIFAKNDAHCIQLIVCQVDDNNIAK
jgi:hypothetical protein